jgi:hypothetical protein
MQTLARNCAAAALVVTGYLLGASGLVRPTPAQETPPASDRRLPDEVLVKLKEAQNALNGAMLELQRLNLYMPAMQGMNAFAVSVGGLDVKNDLETTRTVDPETFAALYADRATDEIAPHLTRDENGRVMYKGRVVRMYPISRLKQLFTQRDAIAGQRETPGTKKAANP